MALLQPSLLRDVTGLTPDQITRIRDFLQGAVYCWCKNRPDEWFSLRDLMGGENTYWAGTPLLALYQKHHPAADAVTRAGQDGGWLLKRVIADDARTFETREAEMIRQYRWVHSQGGATDVIVRPVSAPAPVPAPAPAPDTHPLCGSVVRYDRPTDPVAESDWGVLQ